MNLKINIPSPYLTVTKDVNDGSVSLHIGSAETGPLVELLLSGLPDDATISCHCNDFEQIHIPAFGAVEVNYLNDNGADCR